MAAKAVSVQAILEAAFEYDVAAEHRPPLPAPVPRLTRHGLGTFVTFVADAVAREASAKNPRSYSFLRSREEKELASDAVALLRAEARGPAFVKKCNALLKEMKPHLVEIDTQALGTAELALHFHRSYAKTINAVRGVVGYAMAAIGRNEKHTREFIQSLFDELVRIEADEARALLAPKGTPAVASVAWRSGKAFAKHWVVRLQDSRWAAIHLPKTFVVDERDEVLATVPDALFDEAVAAVGGASS